MIFVFRLFLHRLFIYWRVNSPSVHRVFQYRLTIFFFSPIFFYSWCMGAGKHDGFQRKGECWCFTCFGSVFVAFVYSSWPSVFATITMSATIPWMVLLELVIWYCLTVWMALQWQSNGSCGLMKTERAFSLGVSVETTTKMLLLGGCSKINDDMWDFLKRLADVVGVVALTASLLSPTGGFNSDRAFIAISCACRRCILVTSASPLFTLTAWLNNASCFSPDAHSSVMDERDACPLLFSSQLFLRHKFPAVVTLPSTFYFGFASC